MKTPPSRVLDGILQPMHFQRRYCYMPVVEMGVIVHVDTPSHIVQGIGDSTSHGFVLNK